MAFQQLRSAVRNSFDTNPVYQTVIKPAAQAVGSFARGVAEPVKRFAKEVGSRSNMSIANELPKRYGHAEAMGYTLSGGTGNPARNVQSWLHKKNLPGQVISGALADQREQSPQFQINTKMSRGQPLTEVERNMAQESGMQFVAGVSTPLNKAIRPLTVKGPGKPNWTFDSEDPNIAWFGNKDPDKAKLGISPANEEGTAYQIVQNNTPLNKMFKTGQEAIEYAEKNLLDSKDATPLSQRIASALKTPPPVVPTVVPKNPNLVQEVRSTIEKAHLQQKTFSKDLDSVAKELNKDFALGPVKGELRSVQKLVIEENEVLDRMKDWNRGSIFVNDLAGDLDISIAAIQRKFGSRINRIKDGRGDDLYKKVIVNVPGDQGVMTEIQLTTPKMWEAKMKLGGQELYDRWRSIPENSSNKLLADKQELWLLMNELYGNASK